MQAGFAGLDRSDRLPRAIARRNDSPSWRYADSTTMRILYTGHEEGPVENDLDSNGLESLTCCTRIRFRRSSVFGMDEMAMTLHSELQSIRAMTLEQGHKRVGAWHWWYVGAVESAA